MSVGVYKTAGEVLLEAEVGDLIEFKRVGYQHWGVYVGNGCIIHVNLPSRSAKTAVISKDKLVDISGDDKCRVNNLTWKAAQKNLTAYDARRIVKNAEDRMGQVIEYSLLADNCEYFATKCRYGTPFCQQVEGPSDTMVTYGALGAAICAAVAFIGMAIKVPAKRRHQN